MQISEAQPGGERQVAEVHVRAWKAAYRRLLPDDFLRRPSPTCREGALASRST